LLGNRRVMQIIIEAIRAIALGALSIACFTFLTVQWSIVSGRLPKFSDAKDLQAHYKKIRKDAKEKGDEAWQFLANGLQKIKGKLGINDAAP
jgi:hypothetical protein